MACYIFLFHEDHRKNSINQLTGRAKASGASSSDQYACGISGPGAPNTSAMPPGDKRPAGETSAARQQSYTVLSRLTQHCTLIFLEKTGRDYCGTVNTKPRILGRLIGRSGIQPSEPTLPIAKIADALDTAPKNTANGCERTKLTFTLLGQLRFHVGFICCAKCCSSFGCKSDQGRFYNFQSNKGQPSATDHDPAGG